MFVVSHVDFIRPCGVVFYVFIASGTCVVVSVIVVVCSLCVFSICLFMLSVLCLTVLVNFLLNGLAICVGEGLVSL